MVDPERGPGDTYRVKCPTCDAETAVPSRIVAMDIVEDHYQDEDCADAVWEVVEDD